MDLLRHAAAIAAFDAVNANDPRTLLWAGEVRPRELVHAELMTHWVQRLDVEPDEAQLLAARAHHLRRWALPRGDYPEGRTGYRRWRTELGRRHAEEAGKILVDLGYHPSEVVRVQQLIAKTGPPSDPAAQTHEDALCLVFLTSQLTALSVRLGDDKTVEVLQRTVAKMSPAGRAEALALDLAPADRALLDRALS